MEACLFKLPLAVIWSLWQHYKWTQQFCGSDVSFWGSKEGKNMHPLCVYVCESETEREKEREMEGGTVNNFLLLYLTYWTVWKGTDEWNSERILNIGLFVLSIFCLQSFDVSHTHTHPRWTACKHWQNVPFQKRQ